MTFVAGPRQVGKTTLAKALPGAKAGYLSWDVAGRPRADPAARAAAREALGLRRDPQVPAVAELPQGSLRRPPRGPADPRDRERPPRPLPLRRRLAPGALSPPPAPPALRGRAEADAPGRAPRPPDPRRLPRALPRRVPRSRPAAGRGSTGHLLVREEIAGLERVSDLGSLELLMLRASRAASAPRSPSTPCGRTCRSATRRSRGWVSVLERLYAVFRLAAVRRAAPPRREEGAEALPLRLDARPRAAARFENLVAVAPPEVGPLRAGRRRAATSSCATSATRTGARSTSSSSKGATRSSSSRRRGAIRTWTEASATSTRGSRRWTPGRSPRRGRRTT